MFDNAILTCLLREQALRAPSKPSREPERACEALRRQPLYQRPRRLTHVGDSLAPDFLTPWRGRIRVMPSAVRLREDYSAEELRGLARRSKSVNQSRRLLSLAGSERDGSRRGGEDRGHGPTDAAGLDPS